ncbi:MAG TPA: GspH/FimT family pseudopilin [Gemmatimonadales bacterium]|nr:GspH/FimT family pseudopilin [Gemmatimonadales bacterium]
MERQGRFSSTPILGPLVGPGARRARPRPFGFSLIEMLIVLVVIGLLVGITAPRIDVVKYRLEAGMQGVGMTLLAAERQAITQQHDVVVTFDVPNGVIHIFDDANNNGVKDAGERERGMTLAEGVVFGRAEAPARPMGAGPVTFTRVVNGLPALVFHRDGSASENGGFYLTSTRAVQSGKHLEDTRSVEVERATGRATWYRYGPPAWRQAF